MSAKSLLMSASEGGDFWLDFHGVKALLTPRTSSDDSRRVGITAGASIFFFVLSVIFAAYTATGGFPLGISIASWVGCFVFSCNLLLMRRAGTRPTAFLLCVELILFLFIAAASGGGLLMLAGPWNILIPLLAAFLVGFRGSLFFGAAILVECVLFFWLESTGRLPPGRSIGPGVLLGSCFGAICLVTAMGVFNEAAHAARRVTLLRQADLYDAVLRAQADIGEAVIMLDGRTAADWEHPVLLNMALANMTGYSEQELRSRPSIFELLAPEEAQEARRLISMAVTSGTPFETTAVRKDGQRIRVEIAAKSYATNARSGAVALIRDVSERDRARVELERRALFDDLTGLPNRSLFQDRLRHVLATSERSKAPAALLLMDLDRFKEINDTFGHAAGDLLLQEIAKRLRPAFRQSDTVARLGGDEFAIVLPQADASKAVALAERIRRVLHQPVVIEGRTLEVSASIGIALYPDHGKEPEVLLRRADVAMYAAKREATGHAVYEEGKDGNRATSFTMTAELRQAIEQRVLALHYQPQISLQTGEIVGIEALARWPLPGGGMRPPGEFIPLAESTGLIRPLLSWSIGEALRDLKALRGLGWEIPVAVNLSMRNLVDPELPDLVATFLTSSGTPPELLELELTESTIMEDAKRSLEVLHKLRALGVRLSVDDFGTGYSSLAYLHRLPVNTVKLDRSFITGLRVEKTSVAIVGSTIALAHSLNFKVTAEGIEEPEALGDLKRLNCDAAQGYFISRPVPLDRLIAWLDGRRQPVTHSGLRAALRS